ncbi:ribonuclease T2 family protein [Martelella mediterranea]|uniref:Ribonuclease T2 n=1 Tax=Martelella mediterranea TaxID=293089 RepID=A0A4R3NUT4_9HYPH|nr:ribonuclease [Martelella mediterranea]TCT40307.1 ribonuclease T2 [Martelella mediterranea]
MRQLVAALIGIVGLSAASPALAAKTDALLAVSWQPAFCEGHSDRAECKSQTSARYDASHFSLHGLWPMNDEYCGVSDAERATDESGAWSKLPALSLSSDLEAELKKVMPGVQSNLQRHEWVKHGTCTRFTPENYYQTATELLNQLNGSVVAELFKSHIGKQLSSDEIVKAFDSAFGRNAGRRVKVSCVSDGNRVLIDEITIGLSKQYAPGTSLEDLIQGAGSTSIGCDGGIVDAAGLQ